MSASLWAELDGLRTGLLQPPGHATVPLPALGRAIAASDDLELGAGRLGLRVFASDHGHGHWQLDFRDSDRGGSHAEGFAIDRERLRVAIWLAIRDVLGPEVLPRTLEDAITCELAAGGWVGEMPDDPARAAFAMARVYDVMRTVMSSAWPQHARAGSCTLGAIVSIAVGHHGVLEVLPGGEGATASSSGRNAIAGPILAPRSTIPPDLVEVSESPRLNSGGVGVWHGGDGVVRSHRLRAPATVHVAIDRRSNPPHGANRGGPPRGAEVYTIDVEGHRSALAPWREHALPADTTLVVATAGGGGFGYPQWQGG